MRDKSLSLLEKEFIQESKSALRKKYEKLSPFLTEKTKRLLCAADAISLGGGKAMVSNIRSEMLPMQPAGCAGCLARDLKIDKLGELE